AWKASARRNALLVREFEQPLGTDVVLDWDMLAGQGRESRIRRLARWIDEAERGMRRYRLRLPGQPATGPGSGQAHRHACLRALALLPGEADAARRPVHADPGRPRLGARGRRRRPAAAPPAAATAARRRHRGRGAAPP